MKRIKKILMIWALPIMFLASASCSSGGDDGGETPTDDDLPDLPPIGGTAPSATTLLFPEDNTECNEGTIISDTQSRVTFQWTASENTDSYEVSLRNLSTNTIELTPSNTNEADIVLSRGTPYEWFVVSKADGVETTAESSKWKFYNQGPGLTYYAPFPAEAVSPKMGQTVSSSGSLTLQWSASDVDNDIIGYEVFFATTTPPTTSLTTTDVNTANATVSSGQTYYWRIITEDGQGNTSESEIFEFRVL